MKNNDHDENRVRKLKELEIEIKELIIDVLAIEKKLPGRLSRIKELKEEKRIAKEKIFNDRVAVLNELLFVKNKYGTMYYCGDASLVVHNISELSDAQFEVSYQELKAENDVFVKIHSLTIPDGSVLNVKGIYLRRILKRLVFFVPDEEGNHLVQSNPDEEPVRGAFQWSEEDPEDVKAYTSLAEVLMKVKGGEKLYMKDPLFHKSIKMIVFYKADPIQIIADLTMKIAKFNKTFEDYVKGDTRPIIINKDEIKTDKN